MEDKVFRSRLQPNAFFVQEVPAAGATNPVITTLDPLLAGLWEQEHWFFQDGAKSLTLSYMNDSNLPIGARLSSVYDLDGLRSASYRVSMAYNLGVRDLPIGSIHWQGNSFVGINLRFGITIEGTLTSDDRGYPKRLALRHSKGSEHYSYQVAYKYSSRPKTDFLPSSFTFSATDPNSKVPPFTVAILELEIGTQPLGKSQFLPDPFKVEGVTKVSYNTNGNLYYEKEGVMVKMRNAGDP